MPKSHFPPSKKMGRLIRDERKKAGYATAEALSEELTKRFCNASRRTIQAIEAGERGVGNDTAECLMEMFHCDEIYLRGESEYKTPSARQRAERAKAQQNAMILLEEQRNASERAVAQTDADYSFLLEFIEERIGWRYIGKIGIVEDMGFPRKKPSRPWVIKFGSDPDIPRGMNFLSQFVVFEGEGEKHVISEGELLKFTRMIFAFIDSGLRNLEKTPLAAPGWYSSNGKTINAKTLIRNFERGNTGPGPVYDIFEDITASIIPETKELEPINKEEQNEHHKKG